MRILDLPLFRGATPTSKCPNDRVLLSIALGEIPEPALGYYLSHLEECLSCCQRSMELEPPRPLATLLKRVVRKPEAPDLDFLWKEKIVNLAPQLGRPAADAHLDPTQPRFFGPLTIEGVLGEGRAAVVYQAYDPEVDRRVALKVLRPEVAERPGMTQSFLDEARALAAVRDPHLVTLYSYGREPEPHMTMELLEGMTIDQALKAGPFKLDRALEIVRDMAHGLKALHQADKIHRDIKPANVRFKMERGKERAILLDLGLVGEKNRRAGTPGYMAPEIQAGGNPSPASDLFSLGVLLRVLVLGGDMRLAARSKLPAEVQPIINLLMDSRPDARPTAGELIEKIDRLLEKPKSSPSSWFVMGAVVCLSLVLGASIVFWNMKPGAFSRVDNFPSLRIPSDGPTLKPAFVLSGQEKVGSSQLFQFTQDGWLVSVSQSNEVILTKTDGTRKTVPLPQEWEISRFSLNFPYLAVASVTHEVMILNVGKEKPETIWNHVRRIEDPLSALDWKDGPEKILAVGHGPSLYLVYMENGQATAPPQKIYFITNILPDQKLFNSIWEPGRWVMTTATANGGFVRNVVGDDEVPAIERILYGFQTDISRPLFLNWNANGDKMVAAGPDGEIQVWPVEAMKREPKRVVAVGPEGDLPSIPGKKLKQQTDLEKDRPKEIYGHIKTPIQQAVWVNNGQIALLTGKTNQPVLVLFTPDRLQPKLELLDSGSSPIIAISSVPSQGGLAALSRDGTVRIWKWEKPVPNL